MPWSPLPSDPETTRAWRPLHAARGVAQVLAAHGITPAGPVPSGAEIAADAERYIGLGYVYGGDASSPGVWDCSSFVSYVLGHDLKLGLPGGNWGEPGFPPTSHGPVVESYGSWNGAVVTTSPAPGDLAVFLGVGASGHIGIVVGPNEMVSALNETQGTARTPIVGYGPYGAPLSYRRILGLPPGPGIPPPGGAPGGPGSAGASLVALMVVAGLVGLVVLGAAVAGGAVVAGTGYAIRRATR